MNPAQPANGLASSTVLAQASVDRPLGSETSRQRATGRIGGYVAGPDGQARSRLAQAFGPAAQILGERAPHPFSLVADWDACWDGVHPIRDLAQWRALINTHRLGAVHGAFALAWIAEDGTLSLARDAVGERTLFYAPLKNGLLFASTVRALLATGLVARTLHLPAVARYLTYAYVPGEETMIAGIREVLPGEIVTYRRGEITRKFFWDLPAEAGPSAEPPSEDMLRRKLRAELEVAVRRRLPAQGPVGAFLSGGLDSSLVVALARRLHSAPVHTYSVSFGPDYANELPFSSMVAEHCGTQHRIVELSPRAIVRYLDEAVVCLSDPIGDPLTVPNALLFREAASEVGIVLNGEGGDPCFGGPKNLPMLLAEWFGDGADSHAEDGYARARTYLRSHQKCYDDLDSMAGPDLRAALADAPLEAHLAPLFADRRWTRFVTKLMAINIRFKGAHHILPKVDAMSMPFGVVARSPLFDRSIVEIAFTIPPQLKLRGSVEKYLLKQAVVDLLPSAVIERPKSGMLVPVEAWFRGAMQAFARERLLDGLAPTGLIRRDYLERLLAGRLGGLRPRRGIKIWLLVTLESWLRGVFRETKP